MTYFAEQAHLDEIATWPKDARQLVHNCLWHLPHGFYPRTVEVNAISKRIEFRDYNAQYVIFPDGTNPQNREYGGSKKDSTDS